MDISTACSLAVKELMNQNISVPENSKDKSLWEVLETLSILYNLVWVPFSLFNYSFIKIFKNFIIYKAYVPGLVDGSDSFNPIRSKLSD